jgi:ATP adenylyltransferase
VKGAGTPRHGRDIIWNPWRMEYLERERPDGCVFCECADADPAEDRERFILHRGRHHFVVLNLWPYNNGHSMVIPYRHIADIAELTDEEGLEMLHITQHLIDAYRRTMNAQGVNVGFNLGQVSGGSIEHLHQHLVPRWAGDSNFMPVLGQTKVMVEMLEETWERLHGVAAHWPGVEPSGAGTSETGT